MNERIKQLAEQAKSESRQWLGSKPAITMTYDELEKLAELIVRECALQCRHNDDMDRIEKHFGVEE
jgi:hypothetical protein